MAYHPTSSVPHPRLAGARSKIDRAVQHLHAIDAEIARVTHPDAYSVVTEVEAEGRKHLWRVEGLQPLNPDLPLLIGDCVHNLRSARDHIAYEAHPCPSDRTMFPLLAEEPSNPVYVAPPPGPHADAMGIIEDTQPYKIGGESNPLAILNHLDIVDKHRQLLTSFAGANLHWFGMPQGVQVVDMWAKWEPIEDGDVVMWVLLNSPQPEGAVDGHVELTVKLADGLLPGPFPLTGPLKGILESIGQQVDWVIAQFNWFFANQS